MLTEAQKALDEGDHLVDLKQFDQAIKEYGRVESTVSVIPSDATTERGKDRLEMIDTAKKRVAQAQLEQQRWRELQEQRAQQAQDKAG